MLKRHIHTRQFLPFSSVRRFFFKFQIAPVSGICVSMYVFLWCVCIYFAFILCVFSLFFDPLQHSNTRQEHVSLIYAFLCCRLTLPSILSYLYILKEKKVHDEQGENWTKPLFVQCLCVNECEWEEEIKPTTSLWQLHNICSHRMRLY